MVKKIRRKKSIKGKYFSTPENIYRGIEQPEQALRYTTIQNG